MTYRLSIGPEPANKNIIEIFYIEVRFYILTILAAIDSNCFCTLYKLMSRLLNLCYFFLAPCNYSAVCEVKFSSAPLKALS